MAYHKQSLEEPAPAPCSGSEHSELEHTAPQPGAARDLLRELAERFRNDREAMIHEIAKRVHG